MKNTSSDIKIQGEELKTVGEPGRHENEKESILDVWSLQLRYQSIREAKMSDKGSTHKVQTNKTLDIISDFQKSCKNNTEFWYTHTQY